MTLEQRIAHERMKNTLPVRQHKIYDDIEYKVNPGTARAREALNARSELRRRRIFSLRGAGKSMPEIAKLLKLDVRTCYRLIGEQKK